ncbi:hypothetical protein HWV62_20684 [Athelia sp. TMB]|nr:hypothetical protein HWV62_20684 [Athelia sp. TMB]
MFLGRPIVALLCSVLAAASALKHTPDADALAYTPAAQRPLGGLMHHPIISEEAKTKEEKTIWQVLSDDDKFSRFVKIANISSEVVALLDDPSASITLFALPNSALKFPKHKHGHRHGHDLSLSALPHLDPASVDLASAAAEIDALSTFDDHEEKERRKKFLALIVRALLQYHILPVRTSLPALLANTTHATALTIPDLALDGEALRVRVGTHLLPPSVNVNFLSRVVGHEVGARNGVVHVLSHPLLPPPSVFQTLFLVPKAFGTLTSAVQRIGATDALEWRYVPTGGEDRKWELQGSASSTLFAPTSGAFEKLPWKLRLFLFSPFGEKVLGKLLQLHVVPGVVLHSDYLHNATVGKPLAGWTEVEDLDALELLAADDEEHSEEMLFAEHERHLEQEHDRKPEGRCKARGPKARKDMKRGQHGHDDHSDDRRKFPTRGRKGPKHAPHHPAPIYAANTTLPTLLANHTLAVHVRKYKTRLPLPHHALDVYTTLLFVNGQKVVVADVPARNGALHVLGRLVSPHPRHGEVRAEGGVYDSWADWEEWLVDWAEAN